MAGCNPSASATDVRTVDAKDVASFEHFKDLLCGDEPVLLRNAPLRPGIFEFNVETLGAEVGHIKLPERAKLQGAKPVVGGCSLVIADQGDSAVISAKPKAVDPSGRTFASFVDSVSSGSGYYLSTRSGKGACKRVGQVLVYNEKPDTVDPNDVIVKALVQCAPVPLLIPEGVGFQMVFWLGASGNNFGLHTDLFSEQFLVQHQGVKEIFLLLPEDASVVAPFSFLSNPLFYKSERRSVANLQVPKGCLLKAMLHPGDVLYIPPWWWHEVCTVSTGPSLSSTFRFHTEDDERFNSVMRSFYRFHDNAQKRSARLAQHIRTYFAHAMASVETEDGDETALSKRSSGNRSLASFTLVALSGLVAGSLIGFVAGRRSLTSR